MIWEQEIYFEFYIHRAANDVFTFEADEAMTCLYFADENEADNFMIGIQNRMAKMRAPKLLPIDKSGYNKLIQ